MTEVKYMNDFEILQHSIVYSNNILDKFNKDIKLVKVSDFVLASLYRKIIELSDGVFMAAKEGIYASTMLNYRALIEASHAFNYIFLEEETIESKSIAYKIAYHHQQLAAADMQIKLFGDDEPEVFQRKFAANKDELEKLTDTDVMKKFNQKLNKRKGYIPKWYSLFGDANNMRELSEFLEKKSSFTKEEREVDRNGMIYSLYGLLSLTGHSYIDLNAIIEIEDDYLVKPVRLTVDENVKNNGPLIHTKAMLSTSIVLFARHFFAEDDPEIMEFYVFMHSYIQKNLQP